MKNVMAEKPKFHIIHVLDKWQRAMIKPALQIIKPLLMLMAMMV